ncbi:MAG: acetyl-CoA hydrolase/transferase family protein [Micrococcales bacterium]|nr:acetyl-CoA hydrolase/transferase family protein [Micrococcales bacterium]MCL2668363.1 acetyl-CoA hydrolase/transferase family protein [Micrococcales bacterium]
MSRIRSPQFQNKIMSADDAAALINDGDQLGLSGFTGSGYPKAVPGALSRRVEAARAAGDDLRIGLCTGASTAPECDGELAGAGAVSFRMPYQSDPVMRNAINAGDIDYCDIHLSHSGPVVRHGFLGSMDVAVVEVTAITESGALIPSSSIGNNNVWLDSAKKVILEVNEWQSLDLEGMHDLYTEVHAPPHNVPIPLVEPGDRIGATTLHVDPDKVIAVVPTNAADRNTPFKALDDDSKTIGDFYVDFLLNEAKQGRLPKELLPLQSGVGNIANAVLAGLLAHPQVGHLTSYTEVIQDGMVDLIDAGKLDVASATAFSLSPEAAEKMNDRAAFYRKYIVLRPQEISNNPEIIRRLGVLSCNGMVEADLYGNINSTHIMGSRMQNGIGGSADFTRNAYISAFVSPSTAKGGAISCIVPMVSHHDHTEHDVMVVITEQGVADLRGLAPRKRAQAILKVAHPTYRPMLEEYVERAAKNANGLHTPHDLAEALSWHVRMLATGSMLPS